MVYTYNMRRVSAINIALLFVLMTCIAGRKDSMLRSKYAQSFAKKALKIHNYYRGIHKAFPLNLSAKLNANAWNYARKLAGLKVTVKENPLERQLQGQNAFIWCSSRKKRLSAKSAVKTWYKEVCKYNFSRAKWSPWTRHFTQLVWRSTRSLGVGVVHNKNCTYVVTRYRPKGNIPGLFTKNVRKGTFNRRNACGSRRRHSWFPQ